MTPNHRPPACLKLTAALDAPRQDTCSPRSMRSAARGYLLVALSCALGLGITGCKPFGTRPEASVDPDDWAPPNRNSYSMPHQFQSKYKGKNEPSKVTKPASTPAEPATAKATDSAAAETKKADAGITTSAKKEELPSNKAAANTAPAETGVPDMDIESAIANLPPHLQEVFRNQIAATEARKNPDIKNLDVAAKPPAALASISSTTPSESQGVKEANTHAPATTPSPAPTALPSPVQLASNTEPAPKAAPVRMSLSDSSADTPSPQLTVPPLPSAVLPANANAPLVEAQKAVHVEPTVVQTAEATSAAKGDQTAVTTASIVEPQPINAMEWGEAVQVAASSLEKKLAENPSMDERVRLNFELALRMIHLANNDLEQALKPIDRLQPAEQEYYRYQLQALYDSGNPEGIPVASRRWALVMENQRKANQHLSSISNLEVRNAGFCTDVQGYGVVTKFQSTMFKPDQDVLLYCELENVSAEQIRDGFETQLQGSYEIVDSQGRRVAEQLLPMEKEICSNQRRDYFVAYRVFMPMQIAAGNYEMRVTIEDMKGKKYGQSNLPFQIQK